jgi:alkylation response protein AidB-like acyl-CoA dehydrogenase
VEVSAVDPVALYARVERAVDPPPDADAPALAACARFMADVLPHGLGALLEARGELPVRELSLLADYGVARELVPHDQGGAMEWSRVTRLCARLAAHDLDFTLSLGGAVLGGLPILVAGDASHRAAYFGPLGRGDMGGLGLTEWAHGSDLLAGEATATPIDAAGNPASAETATHFRLDGAKAPINNGSRGACLVLLARTGGDDPAFAHSLFVVPRDTPGLLPHPPFDTLGHRSMDLSGALLRGAVLPRSALLGRVGEGFAHARRALEISRSGVAAMAVGPAATALALALSHARSRVLYGAPITELPSVRSLLARSFARLVAAIALSRRASRTVARSAVAGRGLSCAAKLVCPTLLEETISACGTLLGARSLMTDLPFARLRRSAPVLAIVDGSSQLQLDELWRHAATWRACGTLTRSRAHDILALLRTAPTGPFDPHADDAGETAESTPPAVLSAFSGDVAAIDLAPFAAAAALVAEAAGASRRAPQSIRFRVSDAAARLWAIAAMVEALVMASDDSARGVVSSALSLYAADTAAPLASAVLELAPRASETALALLRASTNGAAACDAAYDALIALA